VSEEQSGQPAQGWYPDPNDPSKLRWWDGSAWTDHTHGGDAAATPAEAQPAATQPQATPAAQSAPAASTTSASGIVTNAAPGAGASGARPAPSSSSSGEKGVVGRWLQGPNLVLLIILAVAVLLFILVMSGVLV
jgi:hypothetical protein